MIKPGQKFLTTRQAAEYLGWPYNYFRNNLTKLTDFGVTLIQRFKNPKASYMFDKDELDRAAEQWRVHS